MKNKQLALLALFLWLNVAHAQSPIDLLKKAAEAINATESQRTPAAPPSPASPAPSVPAKNVAAQGTPGAVIPASPSPGEPVGPGAPAVRTASEMQSSEVEMLLTKSRATSWADAQKKAVTKVNDGDPLWLYIKADKPMKSYIHRRNNPSTPADLEFVIAPQGAYTSMRQSTGIHGQVWALRPEEMEMKEITISLAPMGTREFSWPDSHISRGGKANFFLEFVAGDSARRGQWHNEIFVLGSKQHVNANGEAAGGIRSPMAVTSILVDVPDGISKYKAMRNEDCTPDPSYKKPCKVRQ
jgi:hypothetical protein